MAKPRASHTQRTTTPESLERRSAIGLIPPWIRACAVFLLLCSAAQSRAEDADYAPNNRNWNGLSQLLAIARDSVSDARPAARIDLSALRAEDGMLVLYPAVALPRADLTAFMNEGGRLAIADDFGAGSALLQAFGIGRHAPLAPPRERRLRGNINVLIAKPELQHPLTHGVPALVTNHPQVLHHDTLQPVFSLDAQHSAVVLSGGVGSGRLVALGDPSMLINNMLEFHGNQAFAANLVRYLAPHGRLWIATPNTEWVGHYGHVGSGDPLALLRVGLQRLSQVRLPPAAVRLTTLVLAGLLLFAAATALPRRSSYARAVALPVLETIAGFAGRVRFFARSKHNLNAPVLTYKLEFERRLLEALALPQWPALNELEPLLQARGYSASVAAEARALMLELGQIALDQDRPPAPPAIDPRKFHAIVASGDRILAALGQAPARATRS